MALPIMSSTASQSGAHWNNYWSGSARSRDQAVTGDAPGDLFEGFWADFFQNAVTLREDPVCLDIACGAGVVLKRAYGTSGARNGLFLGVDYAPAAVGQLSVNANAGNRKILCGVAASATALPFAQGTVDVMTSQFGIEYAGIDAFSEAAHMLAPAGEGAFIMHYHGGGIFTECAENHAFLSAIIESGVFVQADNYHQAPGESALRALSQTLSALADKAQGVDRSAATLTLRLCHDIGRAASRHAAFDTHELVSWLAQMETEVRLYANRMAAMTGCALSHNEVSNIRQLMKESGLVVDEPVVLRKSQDKPPAAWALTFQRP